MRNRTTRLLAFDYSGVNRYSLTFCTFGRERWFSDPDVVGVMLTQLERAAHREGFDVLAYCAMPDHLHLLVQGQTPTSDARRFIKLTKQLTEYAHRQRWSLPLWQASAWDRVLRDAEGTWDVVRYILANPVRAGLVAEPLDYPHSGSMIWERAELIAAFDHTPRT